MSERELLPCPFCGQTPSRAWPRTCDRDSPYDAADRAYPIVRCECGAEVPGEDWGEPPTAVVAWNRRAALEASHAPVPREPTGAMLAAADPIYNDAATCRNIWRAMYDAAAGTTPGPKP